VLALQGFADLRRLLDDLTSLRAQDLPNLYPVAGDVLRCVTLCLMAWAWARLDAQTPPQAPTSASLAFVRWVWPEQAMRLAMVRQALGR
jgi:hypothetical protein